MPQKIVVIGAMALGQKAACRFKRLEPDSNVILIDRKKHPFYDPSGIPFLISGDVGDPDQLQTTSFFMQRDETFLRNAKGIEMMTGTKALSLDREKKRVLVKNHRNGREEHLPYDKLVMATGGRPRPPSFPGVNLEGVFHPYDLENAKAVKDLLTGGHVGKAVVIGGTLTGLETATALADMWGIETTVIESSTQILPGLVSKTMSRMVQHVMEENGVVFYLSENTERLGGDQRVKKVITDKRTIDTDLVMIAAGMEPNAGLAAEAGLEMSPGGAILVNERMRTSDPDIYAGGRCVEIPDLVTGRPGFFTSLAITQRQGRVIGTNLAGGQAEFPGAVGSFAAKIFETSVSGTGMDIETARREGIDAVSALVVQFDRAHYYPEKDLMTLEIVVEKAGGRVLGLQGVGNQGDGTVGRISAVAGLLKYRPVVEEISNLELPYAPPFSSAMDILNVVGNVAENIVSGRNRGLDPAAFGNLWTERESGDAFFVDCRGWGNAEPFVKKYPLHWKSLPQDELLARMEEIPKDREIILICNTGMRSYESQVILDQMGFKDTRNLPGGIAALHKTGFDL